MIFFYPSTTPHNPSDLFMAPKMTAVKDRHEDALQSDHRVNHSWFHPAVGNKRPKLSPLVPTMDGWGPSFSKTQGDQNFSHEGGFRPHEQASRVQQVEPYGFSSNDAHNVELKETEKEFKLSMDLPGVKATDVTIDIRAEDGTVNYLHNKDDSNMFLLNVSAVRHKPKDKEEIIDRFRRSFPMSRDVVDTERISATLEDGVLTIHLPKAGKAKQEERAEKIKVLKVPVLSAEPPLVTKDSDYRLTLDLPGIKASDLNVTGRYENETKMLVLVQGQRSRGDKGAIHRTIPLEYTGTNRIVFDDIKAYLQDGVLTLIAPLVKPASDDLSKTKLTAGRSIPVTAISMESPTSGDARTSGKDEKNVKENGVQIKANAATSKPAATDEKSQAKSADSYKHGMDRKGCKVEATVSNKNKDNQPMTSQNVKQKTDPKNGRCERKEAIVEKPAEIVRDGFYVIDRYSIESDSSLKSPFVTVHVPLPGIGSLASNQVSCDFTPTSFTLTVCGFKMHDEIKSYRLSLDRQHLLVGEGDEMPCADDDHPFDPEKSKMIVKPDKILVKMAKTNCFWNEKVSKAKKLPDGLSYKEIERYFFDLGDSKSEFVSVYVPLPRTIIPKEHVACDFTPDSFDLTIADNDEATGQSCHYRLLRDNLQHEIDPNKSTVVVKQNKVVVKLAKRRKGTKRQLASGSGGGSLLYEHWSNLTRGGIPSARDFATNN